MRRRFLLGLGLAFAVLPQSFAAQLPSIDLSEPGGQSQANETLSTPFGGPAPTSFDSCISGGASCSKTKITVDDLVDLDIVDRDDAKSITATDGKQIDHAAALPSIDINVLFDYDSDAVRSDQLGQLATVASAISSANFSKFDFVVLGHTDAKGSLEYNLSLSQRRAQSVADVVSQFSGVPMNQFRVRGLGFSRLADPDDPLGAENRRVQLVLLPHQ